MKGHDGFIQNATDLANAMSRRFQDLRGGRSTIFVRNLFHTLSYSLFQQREAGVKEPRVNIQGFGTIKLLTRAPREARNPRTGTKVQVPVRYSLRWTPSQHLKAAFNDSKNGAQYFAKYSGQTFDNGDLEIPVETSYENGNGTPKVKRGRRSVTGQAKGPDIAAMLNSSSNEIAATMAGSSAPRKRGRPRKADNLRPELQIGGASSAPAKRGRKPSPKATVTGPKAKAGRKPKAGIGGASSSTPVRATRGRKKNTVSSVSDLPKWMQDAVKAGWKPESMV